MYRWIATVATLVGVLWLGAPAPHGGGTGTAGDAAFATDDTAIPDDTVLLQELEKAIDLRRREDFDRVLDARDPGELIEHATLTQAALDARNLGTDALFVLGDELFGYLFRPDIGNRQTSASARTARTVVMPGGGFS